MCSFGKYNVGMFDLSSLVFNQWDTMAGALTKTHEQINKKQLFVLYPSCHAGRQSAVENAWGPPESELRAYQNNAQLEKLFRKQSI